VVHRGAILPTRSTEDAGAGCGAVDEDLVAGSLASVHLARQVCTLPARQYWKKAVMLACSPKLIRGKFVRYLVVMLAELVALEVSSRVACPLTSMFSATVPLKLEIQLDVDWARTSTRRCWPC
jgi:hypothetical protein